ncbi:MAG: Thiol:disulfide interchange protein DsbD [Phycisphaerae bacterium]|nr:Thiol:disulfide interchange protein DsbD [Phycisphaerae bacterium]
MSTIRLSQSCLILTTFAIASANAQSVAPQVDVQLIPAVSGVSPGQPFEVALQFVIQKNWHIYWQNSGDSGFSPGVKWELPEGWHVSNLSYPVPIRHVDSIGLTTFIHEGDPILTATITPGTIAADVQEVEIKGDLRYLVCQESCVIQEKNLSLKLPVIHNVKEIQPANIDTFTKVKKTHPLRPADAQYTTIQPLLNVDRIRPGDTFQLALVVDIKNGFHIQSNAPLEKYLIATELFLEHVDDLKTGEPQYPAAEVRQQADLKLAEFKGELVINVPVETQKALPIGQTRLAGVLRYQACNEKGQCFAPENVAWEILVPVVAEGEEIHPQNQKYFSGVSMNDPDQPADTTAPDQPVEAAAESKQQPTSPIESAMTTSNGPSMSLLTALGLAFMGGLILNIMPCVLPVISIKILSFVQQAGEDRRRVLVLGLAFAAGIISSFIMLGAAFALLKSGGVAVTWGEMFSRPPLVVTMASLIFIFALSLFGVFEFNIPGTAVAQLSGMESREGVVGSFGKGVLATILGTPCLAPFMGVAITWAFTQPGSILILVLGVMGVGMALPYLMLAAQPIWLKFLPKPGNWMVQFKQLMGFVLMGTVVWFLSILAHLVSDADLTWTLIFLCVLGLGLWIIGQIKLTMSMARQLSIWAIAVFVVLAGGWQSFVHRENALAISTDETVLAGSATSQSLDDVLNRKSDSAVQSDLLASLDFSRKMPWIPWQPDIARRLAEQGYTVYVDYTAVWCPNCIANKEAVLESQTVRDKFAALGIVPVHADFTATPDDMQAEIIACGGISVPLNIIVPANQPSQFIKLPENLIGQTQLVLDLLDQAGPSRGRQ